MHKKETKKRKRKRDKGSNGCTKLSAKRARIMPHRWCEVGSRIISHFSNHQAATSINLYQIS